ncbi:hypothetical protein [Sinomonas sp. R1AF57]|uniref:hypothetical protein n=1 Tax=Sinomonas sp. R1AF57 TaxID=2020377 RepID=UPI000B5FC893|nr:hypothetical protein [Sinomonas sp. R1AF57]ASN52854.1 hypothetical protein CGQ25_12770 [Sinomonas sp. R1AF57]
MSAKASTAQEAPVLASAPRESYIPKVTNVDPDFAIQPDRHDRARAERRSWLGRIPLLGWFTAR